MRRTATTVTRQETLSRGGEGGILFKGSYTYTASCHGNSVASS
jgi:hypothetical protein